MITKELILIQKLNNMINSKFIHEKKKTMVLKKLYQIYNKLFLGGFNMINKKYALFILILISIVIIISCNSNKNINLKKVQDDPRIHMQQGATYLQEQKCQEAANEYLMFIEKKKDSPEAYNFLGLSYLCLKNYASAKASFQKALSLDPLYFEVHNNLAILYMETNDLVNAEKEFLEYLNTKNINPAVAYYNLATLYVKKNDYESALITIKKCIQFQQEQEAPFILYLSILERMGKYDEALNEYKAFIDKFPNSQIGHYNYGIILLKYNKPCEAKIQLAKALEINPSNEIGSNASEKLKLIKCSESNK